MFDESVKKWEETAMYALDDERTEQGEREGEVYKEGEKRIL